MVDDDVIEISDGESGAEPYIDRRAILEPVITRVVDALGGYEAGVYRMGDEANGCLKDLKKLWRKDDVDDERTVARIFWETRVLPNDLVPILLATAGKGLVEDKRAVACVDLMTAMTWPIDMAEELKELDEELDKGTDYTQLMQSHLHYKAALLKPGVMQALFGIMLPPLSKSMKERKERDGQIINVVLHLIRNLTFIKDLPANSLLSSGQAEFSSLQSKLIRALSETHTFELLLTIAANADNDPLMNGWNTLVLEIFYLLFRGVKPSALSIDQSKQPAENLHRLLAAEDRTKQDIARKATSRHSRFGTTISVKLNPNKKRPTNDDDKGNEADSEPSSSSKSFVLHRQQAITRESGSIMDMTKRQKSKKGNTVDELAREDNLSMEARVILQNLATEFIEACFNPFLSGLLKDIKSERAKITEKDNLRLLFMTKWFLNFFLSMRMKEQSKGGVEDKWSFGLIAEVTDRAWIVWVLKRMREAVEEKPKLWTELQAGIECLTQLLLLIDQMSSSEIADETLAEAAELLQQQLIYNGEVLDIAFDSLRVYKEGTQSLAYLDSSVYLAYALLRMLERWGKVKGGEMYVRKKTIKRKKKAQNIGEEDGIPDVEEEVPDVEEVIHETMFTFEAFEMKFAHAEITHTLLIYLARYKEFTSSENMRRVVSLMHRQAVRAKAEGLFFKVSTLDLFKTILDNQKSFPREQPYKDLVNLINFILRKFFKALAEEPFLAIEAFFPKNRGNWKQYSSWEPEEKSKREKKPAEDTQFPPDVEIKKGYSWIDQLGIAIASLVDTGQLELVNWTQDILSLVIAERNRILREDPASEPEDEDSNASPKHKQSPAANTFNITDYLIPYLSNEQAEAATKNPHLKLLFRLSKFIILDEDADEFEWYVPASITPLNLQEILTVITQFLENPLDLDGKKASELLSKKRRRRRRRAPSLSDDEGIISGDEPKRKKEKKLKEKELYKSAQFIEDSDEEYGDIEAFLEKEKAMRLRMEQGAATGGGARPIFMKAAGTKKRRRKDDDNGSKKKKRKGDQSSPTADDVASRHNSADENQLSDDSDLDVFGSRQTNHPLTAAPNPPPRPKPRPIAKKKKVTSSPVSSPSQSALPDDDSHKSRSASPMEDEDMALSLRRPLATRNKVLVISDDEE
ncbi:timeless protein-domain-containing protein [Crucibulum laeve]|uniref:Timeless protein-domain-containing protein n=1 Tax=Crucibulum laeve TaxID=68775 RepID=A0A5C3LH24_9AGAR|nr:timeless protein-domain-containing protein [Crucibulum laeve]